MSFVDSLQRALHDQWFSEGRYEVLAVLLSALVVYVGALLIVRTGKKRFLGSNTVFDVILGFILGSTLARAINGDAPLVSTLLAGVVLVALHWLFGLVAERSHRFGVLVKGRSDPIVKDGKPDHQAMRRHHVTMHDLEEALHMNGFDSCDDVERAFFERNGKISVVPRMRVHVVDVKVEEGVQHVSIRVMV